MKSHTIRYRIQTCDVDIRKSYKADLIKDNIVWVLSRMKVSYLSSPKWEDEVELTTWHKGREGVFSLRDFEITPAGGGSPLVQATSSWLLIDAGTRRMLRPDHVLGEKSTSTALDRNGMEQVRTHEVLYSDMDFNLHTNNAKYVEWAFDALPAEELSRGGGIDSYQINFNHETRLGDRVDLFRAATAPGEFFVEGRCGGKTVFQTNIRLKP